MKKLFYLSLSLLFIFVSGGGAQPPWDGFDSRQYVGYQDEEISTISEYFTDDDFSRIATVPTTVLDCYDQDNSCSGWTNWKLNQTAIIKHPNLCSECPIAVVFQTRNCISNPNYVQIHIVSMSYKITSFIELINCIIRDLVLFSGTTEQVAKNINQMECDLYGLLSKKIFESINQANKDVTGQPIYCDSPIEQVKIEYTKGSCSGFCISITYDSKGSEVKTITPNPCTDAFCCRFYHKFCIERTTNKLVHTTEKVVDEHPLCENNSPISHCPEGAAVTSTLCIESCDVEFLNLSKDPEQGGK